MRSRLVWLLPVIACAGAFAGAASVSREQDHALAGLERLVRSHVESVVELVGKSAALAMRAYAEARDDLEARLLLESEPLLACPRCPADPWLVVRLAGPPPRLEGAYGTEDPAARARLRALAAGPEGVEDVALDDRSLVCLTRRSGATAGLYCADATDLDALRHALGPGAALRDIERDEIRYVAIQDADGLLAASPSARALEGLDAFLSGVLGGGALQYRERRFADRDLLEGASPLELPDGSRAVLRVGIDAGALVEARARRDRRRTWLAVIPGLFGAAALGATWAFTRRQRMRARLAELTAQHAREEQRWAEIARMAAMTAHEIKNPLATVRMAAQRIQLEHEDAELGGVARVIVDEVDRLDRVLGDFVALSRPLALAPERVALAGAVTPITAPLGVRAAAEGKTLAVELEPLEVTVDPARLGQALRNLVENALDSVGPGGTVRVAGAAEGAWLRLEVLDDGPGMSDAECAAALDFFYTTKPFGTGLGLPIARRIVEAHGGDMTLARRPEGGLRARMRLPAEVRRA